MVRRGLVVLLLSALMGAPAPLALAQEERAIDPNVVVNPEATIGPGEIATEAGGTGEDFATPTPTATPADVPPTETAPAPPETAPATPTAPTTAVTTGEDPKRAAAIRNNPAYSNAANQSQPAKRKEAKADCVPERPPISEMLAVSGTVAGDENRTWPWQVLLVAVGALAVAAVAYVVRRRRAAIAGRDTPPRGALEVVATLVAIFGGLVGLAGELGARIGPETRPAPEATMTVREVHPRITRLDYARKTGSRVPITKEDQREVGNVIWLEIHLEGYRDHRLDVQWGLYDADAGEALLPTTAKRARINVRSADAQTDFVPIWVGYPQSRRFDAQFRLVERGAVRQMAATGLMRGSQYRYACREDLPSAN